MSGQPTAGPGALSDAEIRGAIDAGQVRVTPFEPDLIRPAALSLRLGTPASVLATDGPVDVFDAHTHPELRPREVDEFGRLRIDPGEVLLAPTLERISLPPDLVGWLDGISDCARLGLSVVLCHQVSPGYGSAAENGAILTLEIVSRLAHSVYLRPGMRIGNLMLFRCTPSERPYPQMSANYSADVQVRASRIAENPRPAPGPLPPAVVAAADRR